MFKTFIPNYLFTKRVLKLIIPIGLGQILVVLVSFVDQFMVGKVNVNDPLTSVLVASEIIYIAMGINLGVSLVGDIFSAQFFGAKMLRKMQAVIKLKLIINLFFTGLALLLINLFAVELIQIFISGDRELIGRTLSYLQLISISHVMYTITISFVGSLNIIHKPYYHFWVSTISLFLNIGFNFLFIYQLEYGIDGAAYSTILARVCEMLLICLFVYLNREKLWFGWKFWQIDFHVLKSMLRRFLIVTSQVAFAIGLVAKTATWTNFYSDLKNAIGIGYAVSGLLWASFPAFNAIAKIIIGQEMALNNFTQAYKDSKKILFLSLVIGLILGVIIFPTSFWLPQVSGLKNEEIAAAKAMIMIESSLLCFIVVGIFVFSLLETGGFSRASTFLNSYYIVVVVFPFALLISKYLNLPYSVAYLLTQLVHFVGVGLVSLPFFFRKKWLRNITTSHHEIISHF